MSNDLNSILLIIVLLAVVVIVGWLVYLTIQLRKYLNKKREFIENAQEKGIDEFLIKQLERIEMVEGEMKQAKAAISKLDEATKESISRVGVLRYNPFEDSGGDQSFSIAMLNDKLDGLVMSSLYGRAGARVFAKALKDGKSDHPLTEEEKTAIEKAVITPEEAEKSQDNK